jgi:hypothetical protein
MVLRFCIQDPTHIETTYLYEAILAAAVEATGWRGVYAFASRDGVDHLIEDPVVHNFMDAGGEVDLLVGIDAVTNRSTLERLAELERQNPRFRPKVFWNASSGLFHPKISHFTYEDGRRTLIVGSGNLTPGGLANNFEGYTIVSVDTPGELDVSALDDFLVRHAADIGSIDDEALERAARNLVTSIRGARRAGGMIIPRRHRPRAGGIIIPRRQRPRAAAVPVAAPVAEFDRILIAQVPAAGGRWSQVHFNTDVVRDYFRITDLITQRVYLTHVEPNGIRGEVEVRPCIFSQTNRNHKIEIGAAKWRDYPDAGPPVLAFRELQVRTFDYVLLMPGEDGYDPLMDMTRRLPSIGRGFPRVITDIDTLAHAWPDCPLLLASF